MCLLLLLYCFDGSLFLGVLAISEFVMRNLGTALNFFQELDCLLCLMIIDDELDLDWSFVIYVFLFLIGFWLHKIYHLRNSDKLSESVWVWASGCDWN